MWYLDDGTLCGSLRDLSAAFDIIESIGPSRGLHLNCLLLIPHFLITHFTRKFQWFGFTLLGSPTGPSVFMRIFVLRRVNKVGEIAAKLRDLEDSQMETMLL